MPSPVDGSVWYTVGVFGGPAGVLRFAPGSNPSETGLAEVYNVPAYCRIRHMGSILISTSTTP
jgi:hypothetical protein